MGGENQPFAMGKPNLNEAASHRFPMSVLELNDLTKIFSPAVHAVDGVCLRLDQPGYVVIVGPSGSGKTTILRLIAGLDRPTRGTVHLQDRDVTRWHPADRRLGMVFQHPTLLPHLDIRGNIALGCRNGRTHPFGRGAVDAAAAIVGAAGLLHRDSASLSGGEQQRVALARALASSPVLLLLDEPLSWLDTATREGLRDVLAGAQRERGILFLHVTHDQDEALSLADHLIVLSGGRIVQQGPPVEVYARPADTFVARFLGSPPMNLLAGELRWDSTAPRFVCPAGNWPAAPCATPSPAEGGCLPVVCGLRPEHIHIAKELQSSHTCARVLRSEFRGHRTVLSVMLDGEVPLAIAARQESVLPPTSRVPLVLDMERAVYFCPRTGTRIPASSDRAASP